MTTSTQHDESGRNETLGAVISDVRIKALTRSIGAEVIGVSIAEASRDSALFAQIKSLLLTYKVLFREDQDCTRAEHVSLARRCGKLEEIAGLVAYLSSNEAAFVTGANISINGGQQMS